MRSESFMLWALGMFLVMTASMLRMIIPGSVLVLVFGVGGIAAAALVMIEDIVYRRRAHKKEAEA